MINKILLLLAGALFVMDVHDSDWTWAAFMLFMLILGAVNIIIDEIRRN
jgi:hypothetical protein